MLTAGDGCGKLYDGYGKLIEHWLLFVHGDTFIYSRNIIHCDILKYIILLIRIQWGPWNYSLVCFVVNKNNNLV